MKKQKQYSRSLTKLYFEFTQDLEVKAYTEEKVICAITPKYISTKTVSALVWDVAQPWDKAKKFFETYGVSPAVFRKCFNAFVKRELYDKYPLWAGLTEFTSTKKAKILPDLYWLENYEVFEQLAKDNNKHLIPISALFGVKTAEELSGMFPKAEWKKICKNSYSRNHMIYCIVRVRHGSTKECVTQVIESNSLPSTILKSKQLARVLLPDDFNFMKQSGIAYKYWNLRLRNTKQSVEFASLWNTFRDTCRMAGDLQQPFSTRWSVRRMKEEHERLIRLQITEQAKKDQEKYSRKVADKHEFELPIISWKNTIAKPLLTYGEVVEEGARQGHCVGGYAQACVDGRYLVYSLEKEGKRSTLGISVSSMDTIDGKKVFYGFSQHYMAYNRQVEDEDLMDCANAVMDKLVKLQKEKEQHATYPEITA